MNEEMKSNGIGDLKGTRAYFVYRLREELDEETDEPEIVKRFVSMFTYREEAETYVSMLNQAEEFRRAEILKVGGRMLDQLEAPSDEYEIELHKIERFELVPEIYMDVTAPIMSENDPKDTFTGDEVYRVIGKLPDGTEKLLAYCDDMVEAAKVAELLSNQNGYYCYWQKMDDEDARIFLNDYREMVGAAYNEPWTPTELMKICSAYDQADVETKARVREILKVQ